MKISPFKRHDAGYVSFLLVLATGAILTALMFAAYRRALGAQVTESKVQLRADYSEKEEAILRSIVAMIPNRAIRAMQADSNTEAERANLSWQAIFNDSLALANSRTSMSPEMVASLGIPGLKSASTGDGDLNNLGAIFREIQPAPINPGLISAGINRDLGGVYPPPLESADVLTNDRDRNFPIISRSKVYGQSAQGFLNSAVLNGSAAGAYGVPVNAARQFNRLKYPAINFGYARPGEPFVAKRNWWAFSMNVSDHDVVRTGIIRPQRNFVLSIYEIPSQLPISAASFMNLGQYSGGAAWQNYTVDGGMSVGRANIVGNTALSGLALRRGMTMAATSTVGGTANPDPFAAGARENYQYEQNRINGGAIPLANQTTMGAFMPISLPSESGRVAFIPITRGRDFFDRFQVGQNDVVEAAAPFNHVPRNCLSSTSWNDYTTGAQQCAMRLDIVAGEPNADPTELRFQYKLANGSRASIPIPLGRRVGLVLTALPAGYDDLLVGENGTFDLPTSSDVAYGEQGGYSILYGVQGPITFNNDTFGDPRPGVVKRAFVRRRTDQAVLTPFGLNIKVNGQACIVVYPERLPEYLEQLGGGNTDLNNSLAVNVDYSVTGMGLPNRKPNIPCTNEDYGLVLKGCRDLSAFHTGFSLVTNLRLFVGDSFNEVGLAAAHIPAGVIPRVGPGNPNGLVFPPCSVFAPEKRFGADAPLPNATPLHVEQNGQIGSLARADRVNNNPLEAVREIHPLDARALAGGLIGAGETTTNLSQIRHPAELPPITMMNWLVLLEEVRP